MYVRIPVESTFGYLPHFNDAVLRSAGDNIVIVRTPGNVEYRAFVAGYQRNIRTQTTDLCCSSVSTVLFAMRTNIYMYILLHLKDSLRKTFSYSSVSSRALSRSVQADKRK